MEFFLTREWKEKVDVVDNDQDDTMTFNMKNTFIFNKQKSGSLTGDEMVTIPHPFIMVRIKKPALQPPAP